MRCACTDMKGGMKREDKEDMTGINGGMKKRGLRKAYYGKDLKKMNEVKKISTTTKWLVITFVLIGLLLVVISVALPDKDEYGYYKELLKELGIVILAVFTVSLLYELMVAEKYVKWFLNRLQEQVQQGESNAAKCAYLGIRQIFPTRDVLEIEDSLSDIVSKFSVDSSIRFVARSLFYVMTKPEVVKKAIEQGARVEMCIFDPRSLSKEMENMTGMEMDDINATIKRFKRHIVGWLEEAKPSGSIEFRYHGIILFDSYTMISSSSEQTGIWDLSFGMDSSAKRIFVLELKKPLGSDLAGRYDKIWSNAETVFLYENAKIVTNVFEDSN